MRWIAALAAVASLAAAGPAPASPLARLSGAWVGEGQWMGAPARATLTWDAVPNGRLTRLAYKLSKAADATTAFEGRAYYAADAEGRATATWFDPQGVLDALDGAASVAGVFAGPAQQLHVVPYRLQVGGPGPRTGCPARARGAPRGRAPRRCGCR